MNPNIEWPFNKSTRLTRPPVDLARSAAYAFAVLVNSSKLSAVIGTVHHRVCLPF